jgi:hypothetical protein
MKDPMDIPEQSRDPQLLEFDKWLKDKSIQAPQDLLVRVRAHLRNSPVLLDEKIDELFQQNSSLSDPQMIWKVRGQLTETETDSAPVRPWFKWLAPLAAAATLTLAFISFQSQGPQVIPGQGMENVVAIGDTPLDLDEDMTRILALAANLNGTGDVSKLELVENLFFLFE